FREAVPKLEKLAAAAQPGLADAFTVRALATAWSAVSKVHAVHTRAKETVVFPELEGFFPGQTHGAVKQREERGELMSSIQMAINALTDEKGGSDGEYKDDAIRADLLEQLKADIQAFSEE
ncbi:unnamed protein product, partial [Sphacelaria rigidula]